MCGGIIGRTKTVRIPSSGLFENRIRQRNGYTHFPIMPQD